MAELPRVMAARFVADYGLPEYDAATDANQAIAAYFEGYGQGLRPTQTASNWIMGEVSRG